MKLNHEDEMEECFISGFLFGKITHDRNIFDFFIVFPIAVFINAQKAYSVDRFLDKQDVDVM